MSPRVSPRAFPLLHLISQQILLSLPPPAVIPTLPQLSLPCGDFLFGAKPQGQHCKHGAGFSPRGEKGGGGGRWLHNVPPAPGPSRGRQDGHSAVLGERGCDLTWV